MRPLRQLYLSLFLFALVGCKGGAQEDGGTRDLLPSWDQCRATNSESNPCQVSMYSLITTPSMYDGMHVNFIGYFPSRGARLLFVNRDAADSSDYLSSLLMDSTFDEGAGYYTVKAKFFHDVEDSGLAPGVYRQMGRLESLELARVASSIDALSAKCGDNSCEAYYMNGVVPMSRAKPQ